MGKSKIKNVTIGRRLGIGFGIIILITVIVGVFALVQLQTLARLTEKVYLHPLAVGNAMRNIRAGINAIHCSMKDVALAETIEKIDEAALSVAMNEQQVSKNFEIIFKQFLGEKSYVEHVHKEFCDWKIIRDKMIMLSRKGIKGIKGRKNEAADIIREKDARHVEQMTADIQIMIDDANRKAEYFHAAIREQQKTIFATMAGLIVLMIFMGLIISTLITRSIVIPLNVIVKRIRNLSRGYLNEEVAIYQKDEIGQLADSFRELQNDLHRKTRLAGEIASGNFTVDIPLRSEKDDLGKSFYAMTTSLRKTAGELADNESKYRNLIKILPVGVVLATPDGIIIDANQTLLRMFGFDTKEEFINCLASEYYYNPDDKNRIVNLLKKGILKNVELRVKRKDGTAFWGVLNSTVQTTEKSGTIYINSFMDITERKKNEDALKEAHDIIRQSSAVVFLWENAEEWPAQFVTNNVVNIFGYSAEEFTSGKISYDKIIHPDDTMRVIEEVAGGAREKEVKGIKEFVHKPYRIITKDGETRWIRDITQPRQDSNGNITHFQGVILDITEMTMAEQAAKESSERFQLLFNNANDAIFIHQPDFDNTLNPLGNFIEVNDMACERSGYTKEELLQMSPYDIGIVDQDQVFRTVKKILANGGELFETVHVTKQGAKIPVEINSFHVEIMGKSTIISIVRDITLRKKEEALLKKAKGELEAASKAKSMFLAKMSHEIKTPMNGIVGMTDLLFETDLSTGQRNHLGNIKKSTDTLMTIINDILDFTDIESGSIVIKKIPFNIRESIDSCLQPLIENGRKKNLYVSQTISHDIPDYLTGDSLRLNQVIIKLADNAVKFTDKGEIEFTITMKSINDETVSLQFAVHDTGIGIPLEKQNIIFNPFSQSDDSLTRSYGGSGLGLSIAKQLVELMGGSIWLKSKPGNGSTFYFTAIFTIPDVQLDIQPDIQSGVKPDTQYNIQSDAQPDTQPDTQSYETSPLQDEMRAVTPESNKQESNKQKGLNILLAEDNEMNQLLATAFLESQGHSVVLATTGVEAVEHVKNGKFDCVLMDIQMPEMDGMEATTRIRELEKSTGSHIPIIAVTAYAIKDEQEQFIKAGMDDYLSKPFNANDLFKKIEVLCEKQIL